DLAARQALCGLVRVEAEGLQPAFGGPAFGLARSGVIGQGFAGDDRFLRDIGEAGAGLDRSVARVRLDQAHDDLHQGGLARPIAADQGGAAARLHRHVDAVEQRAGTVLQADVLEGDERRARGHRHQSEKGGDAYSADRGARANLSGFTQNRPDGMSRRMDAQSTRRTPEDPRRQIVEAAIELAAEEGAMAVTLDAVVSRLPFSKGALLHHFPTKLALLEGVIDYLAN